MAKDALFAYKARCTFQFTSINQHIILLIHVEHSVPKVINCARNNLSSLG